MKPSATILAAVLLTAAAAPAPAPADRAALDSTVARIFAPYRHAATSQQATSSDDYRGFSAETSALIARWKRVMPDGEVDDLNDGDWFCLCQDWDAKIFRATIRSRELLSADRARYRVRINLFPAEQRDERLIFHREAGRWKLDDIFATDFPRGLKQALRETIVADERLRHK